MRGEPAPAAVAGRGGGDRRLGRDLLRADRPRAVDGSRGVQARLPYLQELSMKGAIGLAVVALLALALGSAALSWGRLEREVARAEERLVSLEYTGVDDVLARDER